jgi:hypothetical protein
VSKIKALNLIHWAKMILPPEYDEDETVTIPVRAFAELVALAERASIARRP